MAISWKCLIHNDIQWIIGWSDTWIFLFQFSIVMSVEGSGLNAADSQTKTTLSNATDLSESQAATNSYPGIEKLSDVGNLENEKLEEPEDVGAVPKRTAKIHDFCFGIPFGEFCILSLLIGSSAASCS